MKKILLFVIALATLVSCNKEKNNGRLDPNSMLALNPGVGVKSDNPEHLTAQKIIEDAAIIASSLGELGVGDWQRDFGNNRIWMLSDQIIQADGSLLPDWIEGKDIVMQRFRYYIPYVNKIYYCPDFGCRLDRENRKVLVGDIIYERFTTDTGFEQKDEIPYPDDFIPNDEDEDGGFYWTYCQRMSRDTIAYIPNSILREAEKNIKEAYAKGDFATCYKLFDSAITFYPITGAEWRALKAQGIE